MQAQLILQPSLLSSTTAVLVLDLYQWPQDRVAKSDLRNSAIAKLGRARSSGQSASPNPPELPGKSGPNLATLARTSTSSANSSTSSSQGRSETLRSSSQIGSESDAESESVTRAAPKRGGALVPLGRAIFPVRHLPEERDGSMAELEGEMIWVQGGSLAESADGCHVAIEVQAWDAAQSGTEQLRDADMAVSAGKQNILMCNLISAAFVCVMLVRIYDRCFDPNVVTATYRLKLCYARLTLEKCAAFGKCLSSIPSSSLDQKPDLQITQYLCELLR